MIRTLGLQFSLQFRSFSYFITFTDKWNKVINNRQISKKLNRKTTNNLIFDCFKNLNLFFIELLKRDISFIRPTLRKFEYYSRREDPEHLLLVSPAKRTNFSKTETFQISFRCSIWITEGPAVNPEEHQTRFLTLRSLDHLPVCTDIWVG